MPNNLALVKQPRATMLLDQYGNTLPAARYSTAHEAAARTAELATWYSTEHSADSALLPELSMLRSRTADIIRNNGLMSGAVQIHLDNVIGSGLRLNAKPDWRALGIAKGSDEERAEWERNTEARFRTWAEDIDCYCDASRKLTFAGLVAQGYRSYLTSFEILATGEWLERPDPGLYRTAIQMLDPMRLDNPPNARDDTHLRRGVVLDDMGAPIAYWISSEGGSYPYSTVLSKKWKRVPRETEWGRRLVLHHFDIEQAGQNRGKSGIVSVLAKLKMLEKFEQAHLQAAILNAMYAATIESSMDWNAVGSALGVEDVRQNPVLGYMDNRATWHKDNSIRYNGVKIPHLFPGEELKMTSPQHPNSAFGAFEESVIRYISSGLNLSYEQLSRDYSKTNYSSARAAMLEGWRFFNGRQAFIAGPFATQVYGLWLEESFDRGDIAPLPGTPDFWDAKTSWTKCKWIGPGRSHIDPEKDANASAKEYSLGLTTLEKEASARGEDWEELLEQRAQERARMVALGLDPKEIQAAAVGAQAADAPGQSGAQPPQDPDNPPANPNDTRPPARVPQGATQ